MRGVLQVATLPTGVAVIASDTYSALKARDALSIEWNLGAAETRSSEQMYVEYAKAVASTGIEAATKGSVDAAFVPANKVLEAESSASGLH